MKFCLTFAVLTAVAIGLSSTAAGQSLAEVARQEAARRQMIARGKVITNNDLKPAPPVTVPTSTPAPGQTTLAPPPTLEQAGSTPAEAAAAPAAEKDEKYWRQRMATTRDNLARSQTFQDALQARIAALSTDFVNRDDPAQRAQIGTERTKATTELDRVKKEILKYQAELTTIAEEARRAGAPAAWVR